MAKILAENLKEHRAGERLAAAEYNALARHAKGSRTGPNGIQEESFVGTYVKGSPLHNWVRVYNAGAEIPAYSVFSGHFDLGYDEPLSMTAAPYGFSSKGSPYSMFTNEHLEIKADSWGWARVVGEYDTCLLRYSGTIPAPGHGCGALLDGYTLTNDYLGFTCMSADVSGKIYAMRSTEPHAMIGLVTTTITAYDPITGAMGAGVMSIYYRETYANTLAAANKPGNTAPTAWAADIASLCQYEIPVGNMIQANNVQGVGLTAIHPCVVASSSSDSLGPCETTWEFCGRPTREGNILTFPMFDVTIDPVTNCHQVTEGTPVSWDICDCSWSGSDS